jgi:hypothetical protein
MVDKQGYTHAHKAHAHEPGHPHARTHACSHADKYVIFIAFPWQQRLHKRASLLRYSILSVFFNFVVLLSYTLSSSCGCYIFLFLLYWMSANDFLTSPARFLLHPLLFIRHFLLLPLLLLLVARFWHLIRPGMFACRHKALER